MANNKAINTKIENGWYSLEYMEHKVPLIERCNQWQYTFRGQKSQWFAKMSEAKKAAMKAIEEIEEMKFMLNEWPLTAEIKQTYKKWIDSDPAQNDPFKRKYFEREFVTNEAHFRNACFDAYYTPSDIKQIINQLEYQEFIKGQHEAAEYY